MALQNMLIHNVYITQTREPEHQNQKPKAKSVKSPLAQEGIRLSETHKASRLCLPATGCKCEVEYMYSALIKVCSFVHCRKKIILSAVLAVPCCLFLSVGQKNLAFEIFAPSSIHNCLSLSSFRTHRRPRIRRTALG